MWYVELILFINYAFNFYNSVTENFTIYKNNLTVSTKFYAFP